MIKNILERTSIRNFKTSKLTKKDLDIITKVINSSPTSTNAHQFSALIIIDEVLKDLIAEVNFNQKHISMGSAVIVFVGDRYRIKQIIDEETIEKINNEYYQLHEYTRMIIDATIASAIVQNALNELGYGVTYIGGLQTKGDYVAKILDLPESVFVVIGLSLGKPVLNNKIKPKLNKVFLNKYNKTKSKKEIWRYNKDNQNYFQSYAKMSYVDTITQQFSLNSYHFKHFEKAGKYLKKVLKNLK